MSAMKRNILQTASRRCVKSCIGASRFLLSIVLASVQCSFVAIGGTLSSGYVTDDLVVYWDAIDNAGIGVHNPNATIWKNLGSGGPAYDLTIYHGVWAGGNSLSNGVCDFQSVADFRFGDSSTRFSIWF
jgi:hypothetical protein